MPRGRGLVIFQNHAHNENHGRSSNKCVPISMLLKPTAQYQKWLLILVPVNCLGFWRSTSLGHAVAVTADANNMPFVVVAT